MTCYHQHRLHIGTLNGRLPIPRNLVFMEELTSRQQQVLGTVVRSYIANANPVSSKAFLESSALDVSSATVRNEMQALEHAGLLTHPHTSAGRVPTDEGYRYFVERLLGNEDLPAEERNTIRHQFHQAKLEMGVWMNLAATVLARSLRSAAVVTAPRLESPRLRTVQIISTQSQLALMVVVLQGGTVRQQIVNLHEPTEQGVLASVANKLNALFAGKDLALMRQAKNELSEIEREMFDLMQLLIMSESNPSAGMVRDGLTEVLREPEFRDNNGARALVSALEQPGLLDEIHDSEVGTVRVVIGGEGRWRELSACSVVLARFGMQGFATGTVGVVGPTRMPYGRAIGSVRFVGSLLTDMVTDLYSD